jgi:hypothetical protein
LYESAGFVHQPAPRAGSHYARADVYMIYRPDAAPVAQARVRKRAETPRRARR